MKAAACFVVTFVLMLSSASAFEWKGNEDAACSRIIKELMVTPDAFRIVNSSREDRGTLSFVSFRYESRNRLNLLVTETATCVFNQQWFKYQKNELECDNEPKSPGLCILKEVLGPTPIEKICTPARCYSREEVATLWYFIESGRVLPRLAPD